MKCKKCGGEIRKDAKFCVNCGEKVNEEKLLGFIFAMISAGLVVLGFSVFLNVVSIGFAIASIVLIILQKNSKFKDWSLAGSIFGILGSIMWIYFNII